MTKTKILSFLLLGLALIFMIGCASEELTSAKLYIQQKDWDNAEIYLVKALAVEPENPEIPYLLGDLIYGRNKEWGKMNEMFDKALSLGADKAILQGGKVSDYVDQAREKYWVTIYNKGISYFNEFRKAITFNPETIKLGMSEQEILNVVGIPSRKNKDVGDWGVHEQWVYQNGYLYFENGNLNSWQERGKAFGNRAPLLEDAIASFKTATEVNPSNGQSYGILANCLFASGDLDGAIEAATTGAAKDPENFDLSMTAGKMFLAADDKESALIYYKRAVNIDPSNSLATRQLAQTYYDVGDKEMSLAIYEGAIAKEDDNNLKADLYYNLGVLYMQLGDFQQAEDNFSLAYDYNPNDIDALRGIAQVFENAEKWSRAEYFYRKLIDIEPENPQHYRAMSRVLLRQGDTDRAQEYFDKSKKL